MRIEILKSEAYNVENDFPKTATDRSSGYDVIATNEPEIIGEKVENGYKRIDYIQYKTNLKISVQKEKQIVAGFGLMGVDYDVLIFPRSSISKYNLVLANSIGLIDADYRGEILLRFKYVWQPEDFSVGTTTMIGNPNLDKIYKKGDKICQLKPTRVEHIEFNLVKSLDETYRGEGGFGSTNTPIVQEEKMKSMIDSYKQKPVTNPTKRYSDFIKERENNI
jgi:dUTP pyrophosphatase